MTSKYMNPLKKVGGAGYEETIFINDSKEVIRVTRFDGSTKKYYPTTTDRFRSNDLTIVHRSVDEKGLELTDYSFQNDYSQSEEYRVTFSINEIAHRPIYIQKLNIVISLDQDNYGDVIHPISAERFSQIKKDHHNESLKNAAFSPILAMCFVSNKTFRENLYTIIHGKVVCVPTILKKSSCPVGGDNLIDNETNAIEITYKTSSTNMKTVEYLISDLDIEYPDGVYLMDGGYFSFSKEALIAKKNKIEVGDVSSQDDLITIKKHREMINKIIEEKNDEINILKEQVNMLTSQISEHKKLKNNYEELAKLNSDLEKEKLKAEKEKINSDRLKSEMEYKAKKYKSNYDLVINILKVVGVLVPVGIGIYKATGKKQLI